MQHTIPMIVRARPSSLRLFLILRGSVLHQIWGEIVLQTRNFYASA